jgi:hypothetical protein
MAHYISIALVFSFSLFTTCAFVFFISGAYLFLFKIKQANKIFKHPYLADTDFSQYQSAVKMEIVLDYFLRLMFPKSKIWIAGNANTLLAHIDPKKVPWNIRWPIVGLWSGCLIGMVAMLVLWTIILSGMAK